MRQVHRYLLGLGKWTTADKLVQYYVVREGETPGVHRFQRALLQQVLSKAQFEVEFWEGLWWVRVNK